MINGNIGSASAGLDRVQRLILVCGAALVAAAAALAMTDDRVPWKRFWDNVHWTGGYLCGALVVGRAWLKSQGQDRLRLGAFTAGLSAYTLGQVLWDLQVFIGWNPFPGPSDAFFILLGPSVLVGTFVALWDLPPKPRLALILDLSSISAAILAFSVSIYLPRRGSNSGLITSTLIAYPFLLFSALGLLLVAALAQRWRFSRAFSLLLAAVGFKAWLWMRWNLLFLSNELGDGVPFNPLFSAGAILLGLAMALWRPQRATSASTQRSYFFLWSALPVLLAGSAGLALSLSPSLEPGLRTLVQGCSLVIITLSIARQSLVVMERDERLQAEAQARASEERLRGIETAQAEAQRLQALGTLAGGVAHEFNNILMAVHSQLELAEAGTHDLGSAEALRLAKGATARGRDVIRRILDFARQDQPSAPPQALPAAAAVDEAMRLLRPLLPSLIQLQLEDRSPGAQVLAQAAPLQQVLLNLGLNAGQAIGLRPGRILFGVQTRFLGEGAAKGLAQGEYVELKVEDDGPGMDEAVRARVFEPFFSTKGPGHGSGLGLAVVHGIVSRLGGLVTVESEPGRGARFRLLLPSAGSLAPMSATLQAPLDPSWSGAEIIVLDDEPVIARALQRLLERKGYRVSAFLEPAAALAAVAGQPGRYRALITDMTMPGLSGRQVLQEARRLDPVLRVILSTGSVDLSVESEGFDACLEKPYSLQQLELALAKAATSNRA